MNNRFQFELVKASKYKWNIFIISCIAQLVSLYFFTIVGHFNSAGTDEILNSYPGILGLGTTITMCVLIVYGTILVNRLIVCNYIGDSRVRFYLYPDGKSKLYCEKNIAFVISFGLTYLFGILLANTVYLLFESTFPMLISPSPIASHLIDFFISTIIATFLTISMIIFSSIIGIRISSPVATIITGIILITIGGNLIAISFINTMLISIIATLIAVFITVIGIKIISTRINKDEVL